MQSSWTSCLSSPHGTPLPSFIFIPNPRSALLKLQQLDWVLHCENSSQQFVQNLRLETYQVRKQPEDDGRWQRQRQSHQCLQRERERRRSHQWEKRRNPRSGCSASCATNHIHSATTRRLSGCLEPLTAIVPRLYVFIL